MLGLFEVLEHIKTNPGLYLGKPSVSDLLMFLNGYEFARTQIGVELTEAEEQFYDEFQPWLQKRFGVVSVTSWAKLIMLACHDEKAGFEQFFCLLDEFLQRKMISDVAA
jgi:hypothetical protein